MNDVTVFVYLTFFIGIFGMTFAFMWKMMSSTLAEFDKRPVNNYNDAMRAYKTHPEMEDVDEPLLVFKQLPDEDL
tara:strand:- start:154 stop:378 length:225 start_codon:yes stop_codon:yes gene_type:complete